MSITHLPLPDFSGNVKADNEMVQADDQRLDQMRLFPFIQNDMLDCRARPMIYPIGFPERNIGAHVPISGSLESADVAFLRTIGIIMPANMVKNRRMWEALDRVEAIVLLPDCPQTARRIHLPLRYGLLGTQKPQERGLGHRRCQVAGNP
jgi:hypothetical protein